MQSKRAAAPNVVVGGAAIDAVVGTAIIDINMDVTNNHDCFEARYTADLHTLLRWRFDNGVPMRISINNNFLDNNAAETGTGIGWGDVTNRAAWETMRGSSSNERAFVSDSYHDTYSSGGLPVGATTNLRRQFIFNPQNYVTSQFHSLSSGLTNLRLGVGVAAPTMPA